MADLNDLKFAAPENESSLNEICNYFNISEFPEEYEVLEVLNRPQRYRELILDLSRYVPNV